MLFNGSRATNADRWRLAERVRLTGVHADRASSSSGLAASQSAGQPRATGYARQGSGHNVNTLLSEIMAPGPAPHNVP